MSRRLSTFSTLLTALGALAPAASTQAPAIDWQQRFPTNHPAARTEHAMAYDPVRKKTILFGGRLTYRGQTLADTWEYDGVTRDWTLRTPTTSPPPRFLHGMAFDEARGKLVLFGGNDRRERPLGDTWEWDGNDWRRVTTAVSPSPRAACDLAFDTRRNVVVMFGGGYLNNDTWEYDGASWMQRSTPVAPPPMSSHEFCYDERRGVTVAFGARSAFHASETWEWDGSSWRQVITALNPSGTVRSWMTFDRERGLCVFMGERFGSWSGPVQTWVYDGVRWTELNLQGSSTRPRSNHAVAYDSDRAAHVLFGGEVAGPVYLTPVDETWELGIPSAFDAIGNACARSGTTPPTLAAVTEPRLGVDFTAEVTGLAPTAVPLLGLGRRGTALIALDPLGLPGCTLDVDVVESVLLTNVGGRSTWTVPIPLDVEFVGQRVFQQAFAFDVVPGRGLLPVAATNAGRVTIGG